MLMEVNEVVDFHFFIFRKGMFLNGHVVFWRHAETIVLVFFYNKK